MGMSFAFGALAESGAMDDCLWILPAEFTADSCVIEEVKL